MTRPLAENSATSPAAMLPGPPVGTSLTSRIWALVPVASFIWEATVRFQIRS